MEQETRKVPTGVKVIAVLDYISAAIFLLFVIFSLILGIWLLVYPESIAQNLPANLFGELFSVIATFVLAAGLVSLGLAILLFFVAKGLWKGKNWARIFTIIVSIIWLIFSFVQLFRGDFGQILNIIIYGLIGGYLLFSKKVKAAFTH